MANDDRATWVSRLLSNTRSAWRGGVEELFFFLEKMGKFVYDYGMPVAAFSMGLYLFWDITRDSTFDWLVSYKAAIGLFLTAVGLWFYARANPAAPRQPAQVDPTLDRITTLLELCIKGSDEDRQVEENPKRS